MEVFILAGTECRIVYLRCGASRDRGEGTGETPGDVEEEEVWSLAEVRPLLIVAAAYPAPRVRRVDENFGVAGCEGPVADKAPASEEGQQEEEAEDVGAAPVLDGAPELGLVLSPLTVFAPTAVHVFNSAAHVTIAGCEKGTTSK